MSYMPKKKIENVLVWEMLVNLMQRVLISIIRQILVTVGIDTKAESGSSFGQI